MRQKSASDPSLCSLCPKLCKFSCPVTAATADEGATPTAMFESLRRVEDVQLAPEEAAHLLQNCTGCEACRAPCEFDQNVPSMLYDARAALWQESGGAESAGLGEPHSRHLKTGNAFGIDVDLALSASTKDEDFQRKGRVLYWPGCRALSEQSERLGTEMDLLRSLGADHVSLPSRDDIPGCCGGALRAMGDRPGFQTSAAGLHQYFNRQRTWVSPSATCLHTLRDGYSEIGLDVNAEVLHVGQYLLFFEAQLQALGEEARRTWSAAGQDLPPVYIHSSCTLHRRLGRAEPIPQIAQLVLGKEAPPLPPGPDRTSCCGAGDFFDLRRPEASREVQRWSAQDVSVPKGSWILTGDSGCQSSLSKGHPGTRVFDLMGFLLQLRAGPPA